MTATPGVFYLQLTGLSGLLLYRQCEVIFHNKILENENSKMAPSPTRVELRMSEYLLPCIAIGYSNNILNCFFNRIFLF